MPVKELLNFSAIISLSVIDLPSTVRDSIRFSVDLDLIIVFITFQVCFMSLLYFCPNTHTLPLHLKHCISLHTQTYKRSYNSNSPFLHLCLLIICEIAMYALSFTQHLSIMPLQILTQAPPYSQPFHASSYLYI